MAPEQVKGKGGRPALGPLLLRRDPLRDALRSARVPPGLRRRNDVRDPAGGAAGPLGDEPQHPAGPRADRASLPGEESRGALLLRARRRLRPRSALDGVGADDVSAHGRSAPNASVLDPPRGGGRSDGARNRRGGVACDPQGRRSSAALVPPADVPTRSDLRGAVCPRWANRHVFGGLGRQAHGDLRRPAGEPRVAGLRTPRRRSPVDLEGGRHGGVARSPRGRVLPENRDARPALGRRRRGAEGHPEGRRVGRLGAGREEPCDCSNGPGADAGRVSDRKGPVRNRRLGRTPPGVPPRRSRGVHRPSDAGRRRRIDCGRGSVRQEAERLEAVRVCAGPRVVARRIAGVVHRDGNRR